MEGMLTSPFVLMRTRVAELKTNKNVKFSVKPLLKSAPLNGVKRGLDWTIRSLIYENYQTEENRNYIGFVSGVISSIITLPLDRLLPIIQQTRSPSEIIKWYKLAYQEKGKGVLFSGGIARILHGGLHTAFIFAALSIIEKQGNINY